MSDVGTLLEQAEADHRAGRVAAAETGYRNVLAQEPGNAVALHLLGMIGVRTGQAAIGIDLIRRAIALEPDRAVFHNDLGTALHRQGDLHGAVAEYRESIRCDAAFVIGYANLGTALTAAGDLAGAAVALEQANELAPDTPGILSALGELRRHQGRYDDAFEAFSSANRLDPNFANAWTGLGITHREAGRYEAAAEALENALTLDPENPDVHNAIGHVWFEVARFDEARAAFEAAIRIHPDHAKAQTNLAYLHLVCGAWEAGWNAYAWRWRAGFIRADRADGGEPLWQGDPLDGARALIWGEQGVGDQILHAGLIPAVEARGGKVLFECDERLAGLIARAHPDAETRALNQDATGTETETGAADLQIPMGELIRILGPDPNDIDFPQRIIAPEPQRCDELSASLAQLGPAPRIGISWSSARIGEGQSKSLPLSEWGDVLGVANATFVDLQYGETGAERKAFTAATDIVIHHLDGLDLYDDLEGLAALIDGLDLVITVSNVTAHIAAALGKPVWLLLKKSPFWYWGGDTAETPLYPTVRAFRQAQAGAWGPVLEAVASELKIYCEK